MSGAHISKLKTNTFDQNKLQTLQFILSEDREATRSANSIMWFPAVSIPMVGLKVPINSGAHIDSDTAAYCNTHA